MQRSLLLATFVAAVILLSGMAVFDSSPVRMEGPRLTSQQNPTPFGPPRDWLDQGPVGAIASRPLPSAYSITIFPNGTIKPGTAPIETAGNQYALTSNISGSILDERNGSRLVGNGNLLTAPAGTAVAIEVYVAVRVTIEDLRVAAPRNGILFQDVDGASIADENISASLWAIDIENSTGVTLTHVVAVASQGITGNHDSGLTMLSCDLPDSTIAAVRVQHSPGLLVSYLRGNGSAIGIEVENSSWVNLSGNDLSMKTEGILEEGVGESILTSNRLYATPQAITVINSTGVSASYDSAIGPQVGISLEDDANVTLISESIKGATLEGLLSESSSQITASRSEFVNGSGYGVEILDSNGLEVDGNTISSSNSSGVLVDSSSDVLLRENLVHPGTRVGDAAFSSFGDRNLTELTNTAVSAVAGVVDSASSALVISGNDFQDGLGPGAEIRLSHDRDTLTEHNDLNHAAGGGISVSNAILMTLVENEVSFANYTAVGVANSTGITIQENLLTGASSDGIALTNSTQFTVSGNTGGQTAGTGLFGYADASGTIYGNYLIESNRAIVLVASSSVAVLSNNLSSSQCGLFLIDDLNGTSAANQLWDDGLIVSLQGDVGEWIYHNNFVDDSGWSVIPPFEGVHWDAGYPEGGNYWSNHTGPDIESGSNQNLSGSDGVVDTPMPIGVGVEDRYPLVAPWVGYYLILVGAGLFTPWTVIVNGVNYTSTAPTIIVPMTSGPNSTIQFVVPLPTGYISVFPDSVGPYYEPRQNVTYTISFQTFPTSFYPLTVQEYGLAPETAWGIVVGSLYYPLNASTLVLRVLNASYSYLASVVPGYTLEVGSGEAVVAGGAQSIIIVYEPIGTSTTKPSIISVPPVFYVGIGIAVVAFVVVSTFLWWKRPNGPGRDSPSRTGMDEATGPPDSKFPQSSHKPPD
jgi:parallel beta-helix repeat protein